MNTDRIYQGEDDLWYFNVRGNLPKGPFQTRHDAQDALTDHVRRCSRPLSGPSWPKSLHALKRGRQRITDQHLSGPRHS